jgi:tetratricopeptide (TPR) repeat protein
MSGPAGEPAQVSWPVRSGEVPPLEEAFSLRPETGIGQLTDMRPGQTAVLTPPGWAAGQPMAAMGGTGKTQLAVALARSAWQSGGLDVLVWIPASSRDAILTGYGQALDAIGIRYPREDAETAAARFLAWLAQTSRPWLVVIDDLAEPADLDGLWPHGAAGRVLITTRLPAGSLEAENRTVIQVGEFSPREALSYLAARLYQDTDQRIGMVDLAEDLACLPVALGQAASLIADTRINCRDYCQSFADRKPRVAAAGAGDHEAIVSATWSLSLDRADQLSDVDQAGLVVTLVALLDANGIPETVLTSGPACAFVCGGQAPPASAENQVRTVLANLARVGLVSIDAAGPARTVRMHALVQAAIRQMISPAGLERSARAAADALLLAWPPADFPPLLAQAMRACTSALHQSAGGLLWSPECHPVLLRAGQSLEAARLSGPAVGYWRELAGTSTGILGLAHPCTLSIRDKLAASLEAAGRPLDAISVFRDDLAERERLLGPRHPDALTARSRLAGACLAGKRYPEAIRLYESALAGREWALGEDHPDTLASRGDLAAAYRAAGGLDDAVATFRGAVSAWERALGSGHPDTLATRAGLASALQAAGRVKEAIAQYEQILGERERRQGGAHEDTMAARASLAFACSSAGRLKDAISLYRRTLADRERILGPDHPDTLATRGNLASTYHTARKLKEAVALYEQALDGWERVQGPGHPQTLVARGNLASAYHSAGRMLLAIPLYEQTLADYERVAGPDHPDTLTSRANLASAYHTVGRLTDAIASLERTLADCERTLPPGHSLTEAIRENLQAVTRA